MIIVYINIDIQTIIVSHIILEYSKTYVRILNMTEDIVARKLLTNGTFKSTMLYGITRDTVSVMSCPACGDNHIDIQTLCDERGYFYIRCPYTGAKIVGIYA